MIVTDAAQHSFTQTVHTLLTAGKDTEITQNIENVLFVKFLRNLCVHLPAVRSVSTIWITANAGRHDDELPKHDHRSHVRGSN